eukprot:5288971-Amphidinium_carterae.1
MSRHAHLCYAIANACRQAGWNVLLEQDVVQGLDQPSKREDNARRTKGADLTDVGGIDARSFIRSPPLPPPRHAPVQDWCTVAAGIRSKATEALEPADVACCPR